MFRLGSWIERESASWAKVSAPGILKIRLTVALRRRLSKPNFARLDFEWPQKLGQRPLCYGLAVIDLRPGVVGQRVQRRHQVFAAQLLGVLSGEDFPNVPQQLNLQGLIVGFSIGTQLDQRTPG